MVCGGPDVLKNVWLWEWELFRCKILYFTPSSEDKLTEFYTTDLHDLRLVQACVKRSKIKNSLTDHVLRSPSEQTDFHSIDFSADSRRLVWKTNYLQKAFDVQALLALRCPRVRDVPVARQLVACGLVELVSRVRIVALLQRLAVDVPPLVEVLPVELILFTLKRQKETN